MKKPKASAPRAEKRVNPVFAEFIPPFGMAIGFLLCIVVGVAAYFFRGAFHSSEWGTFIVEFLYKAALGVGILLVLIHFGMAIFSALQNGRAGGGLDQYRRFEPVDFAFDGDALFDALSEAKYEKEEGTGAVSAYTKAMGNFRYTLLLLEDEGEPEHLRVPLLECYQRLNYHEKMQYVFPVILRQFVRESDLLRMDFTPAAEEVGYGVWMGEMVAIEESGEISERLRVLPAWVDCGEGKLYLQPEELFRKLHWTEGCMELNRLLVHGARGGTVAEFEDGSFEEEGAPLEEVSSEDVSKEE